MALTFVRVLGIPFWAARNARSKILGRFLWRSPTRTVVAAVPELQSVVVPSYHARRQDATYRGKLDEEL